jgi:hypothetical protein
MNKTTVYVPDELQSRLREMSRRTGRPQADLLREALTEYVAAHGRPKLRSIGVGSDSELPARDSDPWLREQWEKDLEWRR